jgi:hypothetical protein
VSRFVVLSLLVMGWGYYELSGGADFVPEQRPVIAAPATPAPAPAVAEAAAEPAPDPLDAVTIVTRAETAALDALPATDSIAEDSVTFDATSVADALAQALEDPVINTGEPAPLPQVDDSAETPAETPAASDATASDPALPDPALPDPTVAADLREVTGDTVNLREGPGTGFTVLDRLTRGTVVSLLDRGPEGWVYVEANGQMGWMSADFIGPAI